MRNFYTLFISAMLMAGTAFSQPTITYEGNCPHPGMEFDNALFSVGVDPGNGGANQTWNFSAVTPDSSGVLYVINPSETPYADVFTDANIAFHYGEDPTFSFGITSNSEFVNLGIAGSQSGFEVVIHYSDPATLMKYPFHFNDTYDDSYYGAFSSEMLEVHQSGSSLAVADGWGSIVTPYATYSNVLRVRTERVETDSAWMAGNFVYASTTETIDYEWYDPNIPLPVFSISITMTDKSTDTTGTYLTTPQYISELGNSSEGMIVFPNPATDYATVVFNAENTEVTITVTDLSGRVVKQMEETVTQNNQNKVTVPLDHLTKGVYFINVRDGNSTRSRKLMIQ